jgi:hypothetical protein
MKPGCTSKARRHCQTGTVRRAACGVAGSDQPLAVLHGHASRLWDAHVDGGVVATASEDRTVRCSSLKAPRRRVTVAHRRPRSAQRQGSGQAAARQWPPVQRSGCRCAQLVPARAVAGFHFEQLSGGPGYCCMAQSPSYPTYAFAGCGGRPTGRSWRRCTATGGAACGDA